MILKVAEALHNTHKYGTYTITVYYDEKTKKEHISLKKGNLKNPKGIFCRIASECMTGMVLNSADCDCDAQMQASLSMLAEENTGILILLRQEGRGHGITTKIQALAYKNKGYDTFSAVEMLGKKSDIRDYNAAIAILELEGVESIRLATNNPSKLEEISNSNIVLEKRIPIIIEPTSRTKKHLNAKKKRGHLI